MPKSAPPPKRGNQKKLVKLSRRSPTNYHPVGGWTTLFALAEAGIRPQTKLFQTFFFLEAFPHSIPKYVYAPR